MRSRIAASRTNRTKQRRPTTAYQALEERRVLTTLVFFDTISGQLTIDMTENNDTVVVSISGGNVTVNGSDDLDTSLAGVQTANFADVTSMEINGGAFNTNQALTLNGDFSNASGGQLNQLTISNVESILFGGDYQLSGDFSVSSVNPGSGLSDSTGRLRVGGATTIDAGGNDVVLNAFDNDFVGPVSLSNNSSTATMWVMDQNDLQLAQVSVAGDVDIIASGAVSDTGGSSINVTGVGRFNAVSLNLGDDAGDTTNFGALRIETTGAAVVQEDSDVMLTVVDVQSLSLSTDDGIYDSRTGSITVAGQATFNGTARVRIGDNGTDTFNAGSVNFNSAGHVHIWEDSDLMLTGDSTALSLNLYSNGDITDDDSATLNVENITGVEGTNIILGDSASDQFNSGAIYFFTPGDFNVTEDSGMHFTETKNRARRLLVTAAGAITDAVTARVNIERIAQFSAEVVNLGEQETDEFNAGSIDFDTTTQFLLHEDSATNIAGFNTANGLNIVSAGAIMATYFLNDFGTSLNVTETASFTAASIELGFQTADEFNFGAVNFNATGDVAIAEDSGMIVTGTSSATNALLAAVGAMTDSADAATTIAANTNLTADSVVIGNTETDLFNTGTLTVNTSEDASVMEDSSMAITGINRAANLTLSALGNLIDTPTADTVVTGNLNVSGNLVNLGNELTDNLLFGSLTFESQGNTNITSDGAVELRGNSSSGDILLLSANGNLTDFEQARTEIVNSAVLTGVDVIIGDLADDCFDILNGGASSLSVNASGIEDITFGCPEA